MVYRHNTSVLALTVAAIFGSHSAAALELSFYGRRPNTNIAGQVQIRAGVEPGVPVLFETSGIEQTILRPAREDERTNSLRPVYRFEWQTDKTARFYELADPAMLEVLTQQNALDTSSPDDKDYELKAVAKFFDGGKVLQACLPSNALSVGSTITVFFVVTEDGKREQLVVLPEGSVAECIDRSADNRGYPVPSHRFTAKASIRVTP